MIYMKRMRNYILCILISSQINQSWQGEMLSQDMKGVWVHQGDGEEIEVK